MPNTKMPSRSISATLFLKNKICTVELGKHLSSEGVVKKPLSLVILSMDPFAHGLANWPAMTCSSQST